MRTMEKNPVYNVILPTSSVGIYKRPMVEGSELRETRVSGPGASTEMHLQ